MIGLYIGFALTAGLLLGTLYFGGLWWTVQKVTGEKKAYIILLSFIIRLAILFAVFYYILLQGWQYLLAALTGFLLSRTIIFRLLKPVPETGTKIGEGE